MKGRLIRNADRLAQEHTETAINTIVNVMNDWCAEDRDRIAAANALLDRGHGKPVAAVISIPASRQMQAALSAMSDADLNRRSWINLCRGSSKLFPPGTKLTTNPIL